MSEEQASAAVAHLRAAVDALLALDLTRLGSSELTTHLRDVETQRRRMVAVDHRLLSEVDQRGVAGEHARCSTAQLLTALLRVAPAEAKARVAQARDTQPTQLPSGSFAPALLPRCADAVAAGEISAAHVAAVDSVLDRIPGHIAAEAVPVAEQLLVDAARHAPPAQVLRTGALLLERLDPDGAPPREDDLQRRRGFTVSAPGRDGTSRVSGDWTPELVAVWQAVLDVLAAPQPGADGVVDERSAAQRRHDAMLEAGSRLLRSGTLPSANGVPVTVLLRMDAADLARGGVAQTAAGDIWPTCRVVARLGDAALVPVVVDHDAGVLACGRSRRLATKAQRLALAARDGGCSFPQCTRPAAWCQAHHIVGWLEGGPTDLPNLCLLCTYHHREFARHGWTVRTAADGLPEWIPPPYLDPDQSPLRNRSHHPPELTFDRARAPAPASRSG